MSCRAKCDEVGWRGDEDEVEEGRWMRSGGYNLSPRYIRYGARQKHTRLISDLMNIYAVDSLDIAENVICVVVDRTRQVRGALLGMDPHGRRDARSPYLSRTFHNHPRAR